MSEFKIFEIGFNKCATRAVYVLIRSAGIASRHWLRGQLALDLEQAKEKDEVPFENYEGIRFFSDIVVADDKRVYEGYKDFKFIHQKFPDAKFIYNLRPKEDWVKSRIKHGNGFELNVYKTWLGFDSDEEVIDFWRKDWDAHYKSVVDYFTENQIMDQLLFIDITAPNFDEISKFIEAEVNPENWEVVGKTK
ncbi:MAG: hypothetical protein Alis3KO_25800 [Aliiglaciecola sp.]